MEEIKDVKDVKNILKNKSVKDMVIAGVVVFAVMIGVAIGVNMLFGSSAKIATADMEKVMNVHPAFKEAMTSFQKEITAMQERLEKMTGEEREKEQQKMSQMIQQIGLRLQEEALAIVTEDLETVAKRKGYAYVVDKSVLIAGGKDITEDVLNFLKNQEIKAEEGKDASEMPMIPVE
ncbi:MAG: OmpH family outer membrane protein [Candidatus Omnitrophica bacterium]|nr:OmpH family outer membrane protein [Candidatus Omnitrophota bacterium]